MNDMTIYGLEKLEDRMLLAVDVSFSNGTITITGDGEDQSIYITQDGDDILVYAVDADGYEYEVFDADDVKNIVIKTNDGDDYVNIPELEISGNVTVDLGAGDDFLQIEADQDNYFGDYGGNFRIGGSLSVKGGDGDDIIDVGDAEIAKNLTIDAGADNDYVYVFSADYDSAVGGKVKIDLGSGDANFLTIASYNGYDLDFGNKVDIKTGGDYDSVQIEAFDDGSLTFHKDLKVDMGGGDYNQLDVDAYDDASVTMNGKVDIKSSADFNSIEVESYDDGQIEFNDKVKIDLKGNGDSYIHIQSYDSGDVVFNDKVDIKGGDGDDYVYIYAFDGDVVFNDDVKLDGKKGDNEILLTEVFGDIEFNGKVKVKDFDYV